MRVVVVADKIPIVWGRCIVSPFAYCFVIRCVEQFEDAEKCIEYAFVPFTG